MLQDAIKKISQKENLSEEEAYSVVDEIMKGGAPSASVGGFLIGLRLKGETTEEITGAAKAMRDNASIVNLNSEYAIDTCGTGGDGGKTFNISTAAAIIAAAAGVKVAKHGNRAVSSKSGSADVLQELGISIDLEPEEAKKRIDQNGLAFLFAQKYHSAMKNVGPIRKELGVRTIFNILGPLTNPAFVKGQVLGVYDKSLTNVVANVLLNLGSERALVINGGDGLDEITTTNITYVSELKDGQVKDYVIEPEQFGITRVTLDDISGASAKENAEIIRRIFKGKKGAKRDIVVLNSAAALYVGRVAESLEEGAVLAAKIIDSGRALEKLDELAQ